MDTILVFHLRVMWLVSYVSVKGFVLQFLWSDVGFLLYHVQPLHFFIDDYSHLDTSSFHILLFISCDGYVHNIKNKLWNVLNGLVVLSDSWFKEINKRKRWHWVFWRSSIPCFGDRHA